MRTTARMTARSGQFQHVFTFLMLVIIAGVVLILGYVFISHILHSQCQVETVRFRTTLQQQLKDYARYGTVEEAALTAPCDTTAICFLDARLFTQQPDGSYGAAIPAFAYPSVPAIQVEAQHPSQPAPNSVFLIRQDGAAEPLGFFSDRIATSASPRQSADYVLCIDATGGRFRIGYDGKGRTVLLSDANART